MKRGLRAGVELLGGAVGLNNGTVCGHTYFSCDRADAGVFVRASKVRPARPTPRTASINSSASWSSFEDLGCSRTPLLAASESFELVDAEDVLG